MNEMEISQHIRELYYKINQLQVENKTLKLELEHLQDWITKKCQENRTLKEKEA